MNEIKIIPVGKRMLVVRIEKNEKTESGLLLPEVSRTKSQIGMVVALGNSDGAHAKLGDKILFSKDKCIEYSVNGQDFLIVENDGILARIVD
jgi:chaperonin GroES